MVGSSINLCCYNPSKSRTWDFTHGWLFREVFQRPATGEEWQDTVPVIDACQSRKPTANRSSAVKLRRWKKKNMYARACMYTQLKERMGDGNCQTATVASNKWPSSIWHIQRIACCVSIHFAISSQRQIINI